MLCSTASRTRVAIRRAASRRLSTAATPAAEAEGSGRMMPMLAAASGVATIIYGVGYVVCNKFVNEREFRDSMRTDYAQVGKVIEEKLLPEYAPSSWAKQVRIEDDIDLGVREERPSLPLIRSSNPGGPPKIPAGEPGLVGKNYFGRFLGVSSTDAIAAAAAAAAADPAAAAAAQGGNAASAASSLFASAGQGSATSMIGNAEAIMAGPLEPIAPDEDEGEEPFSVGSDPVALAAETLRESGGPDGVRWTAAASAEALVSAWSASKPPQNSIRLLVPEPAARAEVRAGARHLRRASGRRG